MHFRTVIISDKWAASFKTLKVPRAIQVIGNPQRNLFDNDTVMLAASTRTKMAFAR